MENFSNKLKVTLGGKCLRHHAQMKSSITHYLKSITHIQYDYYNLKYSVYIDMHICVGGNGI